MKKITHCRACGSKALTPAFSMDMGAPAGRLWRRGDRQIEYFLCDASLDASACGLLQSAVAGECEIAQPSARHSSTRDHLRAAATEALEIISGRDCAALDIGCNDGTLLSFYPRWVDRYGVDYSELIEEVGDWAWTAKEKFPSTALGQAFGEKRFDIITAISTLEHADNPREVIERIKALLAADGVFVLETLYAPMTLTRNGVDVLQSGVSAVYSLAVLEWIIRDAGLKIFKGALTGKEGGSIRLFITHKENNEFDFDPWYERLARLWDEENALAMRAVQPYQSFERRIDNVRRVFVQQLNEIAARGESIHALGADPQMEALLNWAGPAAKVVTAAVDTVVARDRERLSEKGPRIISETDSRAAEPDYYLASARYKREVLEHWREAVLLGAQIIFVTPAPHVVHASNYASEYGKAIAGGDGPGGVETLRAILSAAGGPQLIADNPDVAKQA